MAPEDAKVPAAAAANAEALLPPDGGAAETTPTPPPSPTPGGFVAVPPGAASRAPADDDDVAPAVPPPKGGGDDAMDVDDDDGGGGGPAGEASVQKEKGENENGKCGRAEKQCIVVVDDDDDDDSDIEDVTELYASKKPRASPEVINVEDVSSDDDNDGYCFMESHWEYDECGNMIRSDSNSQRETAHGKQKKDSDESSQDIESIGSESDGSSSGVEDVTEIVMAKRKEQAQKMIDNAEEICDSDEDCSKDQGVVRKKRKRSRRSPAAKRRKTKKVEPPIEVFIDDKDIPLCPGAKSRQEGDDATPGGNEVDHSVKQRIVKLLNTGFHGESNEHEARNAMKLARRLMERHNLDQAVLLQERGDGSLNDFSTNNDDEGSSLAGGFVIAKIRNRKKSKPLSSLPRWHEYLVQPVCMNFHVEAFKTLERSTLWRAGESSVTFYGIRTNAQLAAYAFKIASERIALMAATYEPPRNINLPRAKQIAETRTARLSYALGVVKGLERDIKEGLEKEEARRKANLRKAQREAKGGEAYHEDGSYSDNDSSFGCADENGNFGKTADDKLDHPKLSHDETTNAVDHFDKLERENTAHLALVDHHKKIASDVLKSKNVKVRKGRKHKSITLNRKAYEKGVIDSKEVDLNQKALQE